MSTSNCHFESKGMPITASDVLFDPGTSLKFDSLSWPEKICHCSASKQTLIQPLSTICDSDVQNMYSVFGPDVDKMLQFYYDFWLLGILITRTHRSVFSMDNVPN